MNNCTRYLGLDVHAETITAAIAEGRGRIRSLGKPYQRYADKRRAKPFIGLFARFGVEGTDQ